jgi:hypothetical protein
VKKLDQVKETMKEDVRLGRETPDGLRNMLEKDLADKYGVSPYADAATMMRGVRDGVPRDAAIAITAGDASLAIFTAFVGKLGMKNGVYPDAVAVF